MRGREREVTVSPDESLCSTETPLSPSIPFLSPQLPLLKLFQRIFTKKCSQRLGDRKHANVRPSDTQLPNQSFVNGANPTPCLSYIENEGAPPFLREGCGCEGFGEERERGEGREVEEERDDLVQEGSGEAKGDDE